MKTRKDGKERRERRECLVASKIPLKVAAYDGGAHSTAKYLYIALSVPNGRWWCAIAGGSGTQPCRINDLAWASEMWLI